MNLNTVSASQPRVILAQFKSGEIETNPEPSQPKPQTNPSPAETKPPSSVTGNEPSNVPASPQPAPTESAQPNPTQSKPPTVQVDPEKLEEVTKPAPGATTPAKPAETAADKKGDGKGWFGSDRGSFVDNFTNISGGLLIAAGTIGTAYLGRKGLRRFNTVRRNNPQEALTNTRLTSPQIDGDWIPTRATREATSTSKPTQAQIDGDWIPTRATREAARTPKSNVSSTDPNPFESGSKQNFFEDVSSVANNPAIETSAKNEMDAFAARRRSATQTRELKPQQVTKDIERYLGRPLTEADEQKLRQAAIKNPDMSLDQLAKEVKLLPKGYQAKREIPVTEIPSVSNNPAMQVSAKREMDAFAARRRSATESDSNSNFQRQRVEARQAKLGEPGRGAWFTRGTGRHIIATNKGKSRNELENLLTQQGYSIFEARDMLNRANIK